LIHGLVTKNIIFLKKSYVMDTQQLNINNTESSVVQWLPVKSHQTNSHLGQVTQIFVKSPYLWNKEGLFWGGGEAWGI